MKKQQPRRTQRFKVEPTFPILVTIPQSSGKNFKLKTLSEGGFGFLAPFRDANLVQHPEIDVRFTFGDRSLTFKGTVQYCTFLPKSGASFFGVKFSELDSRQELILKSIIQG